MNPKIKKIKMIISDIDGVWTDGSFYKGTDGQEFKKFNVNDGVGVAMARAAGFIIAFPYIIWEFWKFISPGMYKNEKDGAKGFIFISSLLFFIGVLFGYYIVTPLSINFLGSYTVSNEVFNDFDLASYVGLLRASVLASGIIFEIPIIVHYLTKVGIVTPDFLKRNRKFALVIVLSLSAIITPPDIASQIIVSIPILILYEISIIISKIGFKKLNN